MGFASEGRGRRVERDEVTWWHTVPTIEIVGYEEQAPIFVGASIGVAGGRSGPTRGRSNGRRLL